MASPRLQQALLEAQKHLFRLKMGRNPCWFCPASSPVGDCCISPSTLQFSQRFTLCRSSCESGRIVALQCSGRCLPLPPAPPPAPSRPSRPPCRLWAASRGPAGGRGHGRSPRALALAGERAPRLPAPLRGLGAGAPLDPDRSTLPAQVAGLWVPGRGALGCELGAVVLR